MIFQRKEFVSHSGIPLDFNIACDDLTPEDWEALAFLVQKRFWFYKVLGIPRGGLAFAAALQPYCRADAGNLLIVDDVYTTGASFVEVVIQVLKCTLPPVGIIGIPVFARSRVKESWVHPIFQLWDE